MPRRLASVVLLLPLSGRSALAQQPASATPPVLEPASIPPQQPPAEVGVTTAQIVTGTVTGLGAGIGAVALTAGGTGPIALGFISTAVLSGLTICAIGNSSRAYEGGCASPILGSYLGALVVGLPLGLIAAHVTTPDSDGGREISASFLLTAMVAASVGTAVGATIGWHLGRRARRPRASVPPLAGPPLDLPSPRASWPEMAVRALAPSPGVVDIPVLAFRF
jgi:hypothetical protein